MSRVMKHLALPVMLITMAAPQVSWAQETTTLDMVVVTAGSMEESKRELTTNVTIINEKDITRSTAKNLAQLLNQNGFQTYSAGDGVMSQRVYLRGFGSGTMGTSEMNSGVLLMLNGHRTGNADLGLIGLENVERVEILRGPAAVQYGPSAMGGVINIITKRGQEDFTAKVQMGIGSYNLFDQKLSFSGAKNGFDFSAGIINSRRDDYDTGGNGDTWRRTEYGPKTNLDMDLGYSFLDNHRLGLHLNYNQAKGYGPSSGISDTLDYPGSFADYDNQAYNSTILYEGGTEDELLNWKAAYTFGRSSSDSKKYVDADPNYPLNQIFWDSAPFYPALNGTNNTATSMRQGQAQITFDNKFIALTGGFDYVRYSGTTDWQTETWGGSYSYGRSKATDTAGYILAKLRPFSDESLILSAGGRYDSYKTSGRNEGTFVTDTANHSTTNDNFAPSVGLAWSPVEWLKLRTHYAEGFTTPTLDQLFRNNGTYIPNPGLSPEKSKTYEVGADLAWNFVDASLTYFHTKYEDKIIGVETDRPKPVGGGNLWQYQNLDGAVLAGFEFSFGVDLGAAFEQDFSLRPYASFTYLTDRKNKDKRNVVSIDPGVLASTPEWTAAFGLTFEHPDINLSTTLNGNYLGPMYTQDWSAAHSIDRGDFTPGNWVEQSGFTVWNWSLDKRLWDFEDKGNLGLRVEVNNIFDKEYAYVLDYPMPGRNFYVGVNYAY